MKMFPPVQPPQAQPPLVDNMFAPEILAGGVSGLSVLNGIVTITLETPRCDHSKTPPPLERIVVGRIALPIPAAQALLSGLYHFLAQHNLNPLAANAQATCQ